MTAPVKTLNGIHEKLAKVMEDILVNGEIHAVTDEGVAVKGPAKAATLSAIRQFLKDNNIEASDGSTESPLKSLVDRMPFPARAAEEDEQYPRSN